MKKKIIPVLSLTVLVGALATAFSFNQKEYLPSLAYSYYTKSKLPTTIDLNEVIEDEVRDYYFNLNSLDASERTGTNLLKNLKPILKQDQAYFSYESGEAIWLLYEISDRDWEKSPASEISGYDASTNTITGYVYGRNDAYVHALYANRDVENQATAMGDHTSKNLAWGTNQEHIWAKSHGFENSGKGGARGDPINLWSGIGRVNQTEHNNYYYGYVDLTKSYTSPDKADPVKYAHLKGNYMGVSKTLGGSVSVFEPQDCDKGDIARAIFYMVARYNYLSGSDSDGIDSNNPNLELTNDLSIWQKTGYQSSTTLTGKMGILSDLLEWNRLDPPDDWEIHRNDLLYNNYTFNRNPFIDYPSWADLIWGEGAGSTSADPENDPIYVFEGGETVDVTGVSLSQTSLSLDVNDNPTATLVAAVTPSDATNKKVTWSSNNTSVATVNSSGSVTAIKAGSATITVTTSDGGFQASCEVTVTGVVPVTLSSIRVEKLPDKTTYFIGSKLDKTGMVVKATYSDGSSKDVTNNVTISPETFTELGDIDVTVSYVEGSVTKTTSFKVTVTANPVKGCFGDIVSTSIILSTISIFGIGAIVIANLYRKKKEN